MDSIHINNSINVDVIGFSYLNNWIEQKLKNIKTSSTDQLLEKFKNHSGNAVTHIINTYLNNLTLKFENEVNENDINSYILIEHDTAKLLILAQNSLLTCKETSLKICNSSLQLLKNFCNRNYTIQNNSLLLTGNKLFDIQRKILEQTLKTLPLLLSNIDDKTLHNEVLYYFHTLLDQNFTSQITLTIIDNLLLLQSIIYGDVLKEYLINRFNNVAYNDQIISDKCKRFYDRLFDSQVSIISICIARGIMNFDHRLVNHAMDIIFLGFKPGTSMELTQISLLAIQLYIFNIFNKHCNIFITNISNESDIFIRLTKLFKILINIWGSRARRSSHLAITIWEDLIKMLINTKNDELLKIAYDASNDALNQFYHRKKLYYTCLDLSIPILGVVYLLKQNHHLILDLILATGDIKSRTIATKLLRKIFKQILNEIDLNDFIAIFYPTIACIITNRPLIYENLNFGGNLSEASQTSITNCILTLLSEFDDKADLELLKHMNQPSDNILYNSKYGILKKSNTIDFIDFNITGLPSIAESIILTYSMKHNRISFANSSIFDNAIVIGGELYPEKFIVSIYRIICALLSSSEIIRINYLQAITLPPKILQPAFIESYLILLAAKTSFTISFLENRQLQLVTFTKFFQRFKNPITRSSIAHRESNLQVKLDCKYKEIKLLDIVNEININLQDDLISWFIREMDSLMSKEFFPGANIERLDMALRIASKFITILLEEYLLHSKFAIVNSILSMFMIIPEQVVDMAFQILDLIPSEIISESIIKSGVLSLINGRLDDARPFIYTQPAYLYLLLCNKSPDLIKLDLHQCDLSNHFDLFITRSLNLINLQMDFLDKYFKGSDFNENESNTRIPLAAGSLFVFSRLVDQAYGRVKIDVSKYLGMLRDALSKLGNFITSVMIDNPSNFDCRGHISNSIESNIKEYDNESIGDFKFGLFRPKTIIKSSKTTFSEFVTSTIWRNISALTHAMISLIRYTFGPDCKKTNKYKIQGSSIISRDSIAEIELSGELIINLLLNSKHRGIIDSFANFLSITSSKLKTGNETRLVVDRWFEMVISNLSCDDKLLKNFKPKVRSTRSEHITICLISLLNGNSKIEDKNFTHLMTLLLSETMYKEEAIYLLYIIVRSSNLAYFLNNYIHEVIYIALDSVANPNWAISNSSSLLFSCCINYLASGSDDLLEDSFYTRHLDDFFSCKPQLRELISNSISINSTNLKQTAFSLIFVIKFNGGESFFKQIYSLLGHYDSRIRHLAVKGVIKYSESPKCGLKYLSDALEITNLNLLHGLLSVVNELSLYDPDLNSIEIKLLKLLKRHIPILMPLIMELCYKFIAFKSDLYEYKRLIQIVTSSFGPKFFSELSPYFNLDLEFLNIHMNKSSCLKVLLKLSHSIGLSEDPNFRSKFYGILTDKSIDLPVLDDVWYEAGDIMLARTDTQSLIFCLNTCNKNYDLYIPILIDVLSRDAFMPVETLNYLVQIAITTCSKSNNERLLELVIGMLHIITSDSANTSTKMAFLDAVSNIELKRPPLDNTIFDRYNYHIWNRLIYILQDEIPEIRSKSAYILCKLLYGYVFLDWYSVEDLACKNLGIIKPSKIKITDHYNDEFVLFPIEAPNIYRERY